jgi:hypothetical protein
MRIKEGLGKGKGMGKGEGMGKGMGKGECMDKGKGMGKGCNEDDKCCCWECMHKGMGEGMGKGKGMDDGGEDAAPRVRNQSTSISGDSLKAMGVKTRCWVEITPSSFRGIEGDRLAPPGLKEC